MPYITTRRSSPCAACGGLVGKGEQAWYTDTEGVRHPEPECAAARYAPHRPNRRAARCPCGTWVSAGAGRLVRAGEAWVVWCFPCGEAGGPPASQQGR